MKLVCPNCQKEVGEVTAAARLILTVHCPFDGSDFGAAVDPVAPAEPSPATSESQAPAA